MKSGQVWCVAVIGTIHESHPIPDLFIFRIYVNISSILFNLEEKNKQSTFLDPIEASRTAPVQVISTQESRRALGGYVAGQGDGVGGGEIELLGRAGGGRQGGGVE